jgi:methanogenic corrinoid protein MtbC1
MDLSNVSPEQKDALDSLRDAIVAIDEGKAKKVAENIVNEGIDPNIAMRYSIANAAIKVGEKFDSGEYFLPHLVMAGDLMDEVGEILGRNIPPERIVAKKVIVIGTVQGDLVGKNLVATMFKSSGFDVHDMGVDVPSISFIEKAKELNADMIALSSLLTTTMPYQKEVIDDLVSIGSRNRFKVMVGGGPVTKQYAEEIGADGYGRDAMEALREAKKLLA